jgi:protease-4
MKDPAAPRRSRPVLAVLAALSLLLNVVLVCGGGLAVWGYYYALAGGDPDAPAVAERLHAGNPAAADKVAVVSLEGVIVEGLLGFVHEQLRAAAEDPQVKAVVLRVNSPGGSVTASDDLHRRLSKLRDGDPARKTPPKKLVVSMASLATSGGYYVAMPAEAVFAERTTITGSIGVFVALPNVAKLSKEWGVSVEVIKRGEVKDSGSMFREMTPQDRQVWQDLIDTAYAQFLAVVEEGRPKLKGKLREPVISTTIRATENGKEVELPYQRRLADGGVFTADKALRFGLVDQIGYLDDAIEAAKKAAGLGENCKIVQYERPWTLAGSLLGIRTATPPVGTFDPQRWANGAVPRLWYLAPGAELSGILSAGGN